MSLDILQAFQEGQIFSAEQEENTKDLPWNEHPKFHGVALKHLITAKDSGGNFSSHLVRVNRGCEIGNHIHEGKWELHEVLSGRGKCLIDHKEVEYRAGIMATIPADIPHAVKATETDLYILAKFIPPLL
jgi:quercetin dioxygenase-like cupin family protein